MKTRQSKRLQSLVLSIVFVFLLQAGHFLATGAATPPAPPDPRGIKDKSVDPSRISSPPGTLAEGQLVNPGFEEGCDPENKIGCDKEVPSDVYDAYGNYSHNVAAGEIFTPNGWKAFFKHGMPVTWDPKNDVGYAQPEVHVIKNVEPFVTPPRIQSGQWAVKLFTFWTIHDAGLYQKVQVTPGTRWKLSAWVHAWTSKEDKACCSTTGDPEQAHQMVGLDPTGGTNPYASSVVWSEAAHIYDTYTQTHPVEVTAQSSTLSVFLRSWVKWPYKHNDIYWDTVTLEPAPLRDDRCAYFPLIVTENTTTTPPPPTVEEDGDAAFGVVFVNPAEPGRPTDEGRYDKAADLGIGWDRWPLYWYHVEPSADQYDWSTYDAVVEADLSHGLQINPILMGTPGAYATAGLIGPAPALGFRIQRVFSVLSTGSPPSRLYEPIFADNSDVPAPGKAINPNNPWANLVYRAVERYRPGGVLARQKNWPTDWGVSVWEIWNEPDLTLFWNGSVADYARLLKVAALAGRQADPDAVIMTGGLADPPAPGYLANVLAQLAQDPNPTLRDSQGWYFDAVALHNYGWSWHTGERVRQTLQLLAGYRSSYPALDEKTVWINESGVPVYDDYPGPTWQNNGEADNMATMEEQAAFVIQNAAYALYNGAETVFHFQLYDGCGNDPAGTDFPPDALYLCHQGQICASASAFGLWRNKNTDSCYRQHPDADSPRPVHSAFRTIVQTLTGAHPLWHEQPGGDQEWFAFYRPDTEQRIVVLWARYHHDATAQVPAVANQATVLDQTGSTGTLYPSNGLYTLTLPGATSMNFPYQPPGPATIGGRPYLLIEDWRPSAD